MAARLVAGYVTADPWSPGLDGVLAWAHLRRRIGLDAMMLTPDSEMAPVRDLPLLVCQAGDAWWYAVSSPLRTAAARCRTHLHRRFDRAAAERHGPPGLGRINAAAGTYKDMRMPRMLTLAGQVEWHAIGDAGAIASLLADVTHIGRDRGRGRGEVGGWDVTDDGDPLLARWHRPLPHDFARAYGLPGPAMPWGLVPPMWLGRQPCVMPLPLPGSSEQGLGA